MKKHKFGFITTCMGRLEHVKESSAKLMADPRVGTDWLWILVDYACPQKTGEWAKETYGDRVHVLDIETSMGLEEGHDPIVFNKPLALNTGALYAIDEQCDYLVFLDADTLVRPSLLGILNTSASLDSFLVFEPSQNTKDLTGFLCVNWRHFVSSGGYDLNFVGWGAEDLELRLKLFLKSKLACHELPAELASSIPHEDVLRTSNYEEKDKNASHILNLNQLCANIFDWTGEHLLAHYLQPHGHQIRRLLGTERFSPKGLLK